jgi:hypothetical protein
MTETKTNGNYFVALTRWLFFILDCSYMPRPVWRHQIADRRDFPRRPARRGRRRRRCESIKMGLHETRWEGVDRIGPTQVRDKRRAVVNTVMNLRVHKMWGIS